MLKKIKEFYSDTSLLFRVLLGISIIIVVLSALQIVQVKFSADEKKDAIQQEALKNAEKLLDEANAIASENLVIATFISNMKDVKSAILNNDRERLYETIKPVIDAANKKSKFKIKVHFHLPPGKSFLRVWKPKKFGDDISSFRKTVVDVLNTGLPVKGIEAGRVGLAIRGVAPIFDEHSKKPIASVEVITNLASVVNAFEKRTNGFVQIYALKKIKSTASTEVLKSLGRFTVLNDVPVKIDNVVDESFLEKAIAEGHVIKQFNNFLVIGIELKDYKNEPTGVSVQYLDLSWLYGNMKKQIMQNVILALFACLVAIILAYIGLKINLNAPLEHALSILNDITHGDFTKIVRPKGASEIKKIGKMANNIVYTTGHLISLLKRQATGAKYTVQELKNVNDIVIQGANDIDSAAEKVASASTEAASTLENVANATQELTEATNEIAQNVAESARATNDAQEKAQLTNEVIQELGENSEKIGGIIQVINSIAEQTNLLALNATIEAARAGEAGKGFAVVANEVKELAKQTSEATEEITKMIQAIQSGTSKAVTSVQEITETVSQVNDFTNTIASAAEEQTATVSEINQSVAEGAEKVRHLETQAHKLAEQANDFSAIADVINTTVSVIESFSTQLNEISSLYRSDQETLKKVSHYTMPRAALMGAILAHFTWMENIRIAIMEDKVPEVELDPTKCFMGYWLNNYFDSKEFSSEIMAKIDSVHRRLHEMAAELKEMSIKGADRKERIEFFLNNIQTTVKELLALVKSLEN